MAKAKTKSKKVAIKKPLTIAIHGEKVDIDAEFRADEGGDGDFYEVITGILAKLAASGHDHGHIDPIIESKSSIEMVEEMGSVPPEGSEVSLEDYRKTSIELGTAFVKKMDNVTLGNLIEALSNEHSARVSSVV